MDDIGGQQVDIGAVGLNDRRDQCRGNETNDACRDQNEPENFASGLNHTAAKGCG
jgi:hypothetical protein